MSSKPNLSRIPKVDRVLTHPRIAPYLSSLSHEFVVFKIQKEIGIVRAGLLSKRSKGEAADANLLDLVVSKVADQLDRFSGSNLQSVINATGVILHTGLGRAPLSDSAKRNLLEISGGYCNLELDLDTGKRGQRIDHVEELLCFLTGAQAACVVNNNAAAVLLCLNTLGYEKETIVSRGQLVEIGGSFRIPDVMAKSGTRMVEVGTTNKTHLADYEKAISKKTGLICVVHTSNYRVQGFTNEVELKALAVLADKHDLPLLHDLGGGVLIDLLKLGLPHEPIARESIQAGADLVTFSGDKVLGGPQCGIIVGNKAYVEQVKKNPLMRALRCDKLIYAALEPTLKDFVIKQKLTALNVVMKMLTTPAEKLAARAMKIKENIVSGVSSSDFDCTVVETRAQVGSGAMPLEEIPSRAVRLSSKTIAVGELASKFRNLKVPIVGYVKDDCLYFDLTTVFEREDEMLVSSIKVLANAE